MVAGGVSQHIGLCFTLDKVMFALVNVGEFGILGKQPRANLSFSGVNLVN